MYISVHFINIFLEKGLTMYIICAIMYTQVQVGTFKRHSKYAIVQKGA